MESGYKMSSITDPSASYAIFDMRKAYQVDKESILDKLENTSIDNNLNKNHKYGSYESANKNKMKLPKGQTNTNPIIFHSKVKSTN